MVECRVLLVGLMGSGKTSVGRELAALTGWPYVDNDELVQEAAGRTAREILAEAGEMALRVAEADALEAAVGTPPPCICGIAAGTVLGPSSRRLLIDGGVVVWLTADPATLAARAVGAAHRPWLEADAEEWMRETAAERAPLFREVATLTIDTQERTPAEVAAIIRDELADVAACRAYLD
jgi:shikimate kinase